jgi:hypothetical protein
LNAENKDGKSMALKQHTPIEQYIEFAFTTYRKMCYFLGIEPLNKGAWLRSEV